MYPSTLADAWSLVNCSPHQLSPAYEGERQIAQQRHWPTRTAPLGHLGPLTDPAAVSALLLDVLAS